MAQIEEAFEAKLAKDGRITVPMFLIRRHRLEPGDKFAFHMEIPLQEDKNEEPEDDTQSPSDSRTPSTGVQVNDTDTS